MEYNSDREWLNNGVKTGTTTVGITAKDGVVMGTERRATMGTLIAHKATKKLFRIDENLGMATAGLVGDAQLLVRYITAEAELYKLKRNAPMTVRAASTVMANILSGRRMFPYWVQLILAGVDEEGGHVYSLDAAGGSIPDKYVCGGSGSPYVFGVMEDHYQDGMSIAETTDLAIRGISAAMKRDAASGNGIDIGVISSRGFKFLSDEEVAKRKSKMDIE